MSIAQALHSWYLKEKRDLPFRENQDPYRVWISEIMAQQTQIDTLIPYYHRWILRYPDLNSLKNVQLEELYPLWEGLGYYTRVRNIHKALQQIQTEYNGEFPKTKAEIQKLAGIGDYTSSAIASICFEEKTAAIDGNVKRVMSRLFLWDEVSLGKSFTSHIKTTIENWMEEIPPSDCTQAVMELGALVCQKKAKCEICPLKDFCLAYQKDCVDEYPKAQKQIAQKQITKEVVLLVHGDKFALTLKHSDSLMEGYYRLPERSQLDVKDTTYIDTHKHVFSHQIWTVHFHTAHTDKEDPEFIWVTKKESETLPLITLHRKWLKRPKQETLFGPESL